MCTSSNGISIWTIPSTTLSSLTVHCDDGCVAVSLRDANGNSVRLLWRQVSLITSGRWKNCSCSTVSLFPNKRDTTELHANGKPSGDIDHAPTVLARAYGSSRGRVGLDIDRGRRRS